MEQRLKHTPPDSITQDPIRQIIAGAAYPLRSIPFIIKHNLWPIVLAIVAIYVVLFGALLTAAIYLTIPWLQRLDAWLAGSWFAFLAWFVWIAAVAGIIAASALVIVLAGQVLASPLLEILSEKTEAKLLDHTEQPFGLKQLTRSVWVALGDLFWGLVFLLGINVVLLPTGPAAPVLGFCFNSLLMSQEFVGLPLARRLVGYRARWRAVWTNAWPCLGFGATTMVMLFLPGINLALLPLATVGGTLLYCDLKLAKRL